MFNTFILDNMKKTRKYTFILAHKKGISITLPNQEQMKIDRDLSRFLHNRDKINPIDKITWITARSASTKSGLTPYMVIENAKGENPMIRTKNLDIPKGKTTYLVAWEDVVLLHYVYDEVWGELEKAGLIRQIENPATGGKTWQQLVIEARDKKTNDALLKNKRVTELYKKLHRIYGES